MWFLILLLLVGTANAEWLKVPIKGNGKTKATAFAPDLSALPKGVTAFSGVPNQDKTAYYIQTDTDFSKNTPKVSDTWSRPSDIELTTELDKLGIDQSKVLALPTKSAWLIEKIWNWIGPALAWAISGSDNFNRTDANPIDGSWTLGYNSTTACDNVCPQIVSNAVQPDADFASESIATYNGFSSANDQFSQITIITYSATGSAGIGTALRGTPGNPSTYLSCEANQNNGGGITSNIYDNVAGAYSTLATESSTTWAASDVVYCQVIGTAVTMKRNGSTLLTATEGSISSGQPGIEMYNAADFRTVISIDDWSGGDIVSTTAPKHRVISQ